VPVSCPFTTSSRSSCSARSTLVDLVKRRKETYPLLVLFSIYLSPCFFFLLFGSHDFLRFHKTNSRFIGLGVCVAFRSWWFRVVCWLLQAVWVCRRGRMVHRGHDGGAIDPARSRSARGRPVSPTSRRHDRVNCLGAARKSQHTRAHRQMWCVMR
jgi:hypothetical protein